MIVIYALLDVPLQLLLSLLPQPQVLGRWALSGAVLILAILALRALFRRGLSCRARYALWGVVLARLLLPFQMPFSLPVSTAQAAPDTPVSWETTYVPVFPYLPQEIEDAHPYYQDFEPGYEGPSPWSQGYLVRSEDGDTVVMYHDAYTQAEIIQLLWVGGAFCALMAILISNLRFTSRLEERRRALEVPCCPLPVYVAEGLPSPCLFGLLRPAIYLTPESAEDEVARSHVLAHELTHYAHKDHIWAVLRCLCLALHWYNPLVWLSAVLSKRDSELACDEGAVARLGEGQRIAYGRTLVGLVVRSHRRPADLLSCSTAMKEGEKTIQQRIRLLIQHPETKKTALFAAVAVVALAAVFVFSGEQENSDKYTQYHSAVKTAESIRVSMPIYSSFYYQYAIEDEDLLQEAKDILLSARDLMSPVEEDFRMTWVNTYGLQLRPDVEFETGELVEGMPCYRLCDMDSGCYVVYWENEYTYAPVALMTDGSCEQLLNLMSEQNQRSWAEQGYETEVELTAEELEWFQTVFFNVESYNLNTQCLTSFYNSPEEIDLYQLFFLGSPFDGDVPTEEEERAVAIRGYGGADPGGRLVKITREGMERALQECMGLSLGETLGNGLEKFVYLEEYDAYYHFFDYEDDNYYGQLTVVSGTRAGDIVTLYYDEARAVMLQQTGDNYKFISNQRMWTAEQEGRRSNDEINAVDLKPVESTVNKMLQARYRAEKQNIRDYKGIELTSFQLLSQYDDLLKNETVKLYSLDFGLRIDDLTKAGWSDGSWVDYDGLFHPYTHQPHLIIIEHEDGRQFYDVFEWDYTLKEGAIHVSGNPVEQADVLNVLVDRLADWLPQVSILGLSVDQQLAERYGQILTQFYYPSLGAGHPYAVHDAQFVSAEVYEQRENALCTWITLAVDPLEPDSGYWMSGNGIEKVTEGKWAGYWLYKQQYRLEMLEGKGVICTGRGSGGLSLEGVI